jgi:hypothetical protein
LLFSSWLRSLRGGTLSVDFAFLMQELHGVVHFGTHAFGTKLLLKNRKAPAAPSAPNNKKNEPKQRMI